MVEVNPFGPLQFQFVIVPFPFTLSASELPVHMGFWPDVATSEEGAMQRLVLPGVGELNWTQSGFASVALP